MRSTIFSPFSQKFILHKSNLNDQPQGKRQVLDLAWDLSDHWLYKKDSLYINSLQAEISRDYQDLIKEDFQLFSTQTDFINQNQACWDMHNIFKVKAEQNKIDELPKDKSTAWRMENLAYYAPAHTHSAEEYGIHLNKIGIAKFAQQVFEECSNQPLEIIQLSAIFKVFAHEMCHAWIEDICCLIDFAQGEQSVKLADRRYSKTNQYYNSYIYMEESICNTAAYGALQSFLNGKDAADIPKYDSQVILSAFETCMRKQPQGYKDFLVIPDAPHKSQLFILNVCRLLVDIYACEDSNQNSSNRLDYKHTRCISEAVGLYFGWSIDYEECCDLFNETAGQDSNPDFDKKLKFWIHPENISPWNNMCLGKKPPLHIEG